MVKEVRKTIAIIGVIFIILAVLSLVIFSFTDFLAPIEYNSGQQSGSANTYNTVISQSNTRRISGLYSSITFYVAIAVANPGISQNFVITIGIVFPNALYEGKSCTPVSPCTLVNGKQVTLTKDSQINLQTFERKYTIPLLTSGSITLPNSNTDRYYVLQVSSANSFNFSYQVVAKSRLGIFIGSPLLLIGIVATIIGFVAKDGTQQLKSMKKRSWQEPTLGGNANSNRSANASKSSSAKGIKASNQAAARPSAIHCKKCNGVMPRNSQYCPHCYTRQ